MKNTGVSFASENFAGCHPQMLNAIIKANCGFEKSYGDDRFSETALQAFQAHFGKSLQVHYTFNGTGANIFGLSTLGLRYHAVICADCAHLNVSESTAPEVFTGCLLLPLPTEDGKIIPEAIVNQLRKQGNVHHPQVKAISVTQPTELGTVYSVTELEELAAVAKKYGLYLHMDGARLFNAAAALDKPRSGP
jgi:threonine aldolase